MKTNVTTNAATINKNAAIRLCQNAIKDAKNFLTVEGEDELYYAWHRRTIEENEKVIKAILNEPDSDWN